MEAITLPIYSTEGKEVDTIKLDTSVFDGTVNQDAVHQSISCYRANQRKGLAATKTRGEVSGGGKKPWKQKGTGRARVGSTRSPLWRHGGVVFGPHPRDFSYTIPHKINLLALKSVLNAKLRENNLIILDKLGLDKPKTKEAVKIFSNLKVSRARKESRSNVLLLLDKIDKELRLALRNIGFLTLNLAKDANTYEILSCQKLIVTKDSIGILTKRIKQ